ncbi:MAG: DUF3179 domain-containing protein [Alphaproteobacteria bacterium]|nr:DUF3179 domain-containing protein [Alphaproteobacteria bacterium]
MRRLQRWRAACLGVLLLSWLAPAGATELAEDELADAGLALIFADAETRAAASKDLVSRGKPDVVAHFILAMRFTQVEDERFGAALRALTGYRGTTWFDWMLWQESRPDIRPHPSFASMLIALMTRIDPRFEGFLAPFLHEPGRQRVRLEEVVWGGVPVDGIPPLDRPKRIAAAEAGYLADDDLVFGLAIAGDTRVYPLRIMGWHEMLNDVVGGQPVSLAYCTLCGAGILYDTRQPGDAAAMEFSTSGLLYRSNKLMYDRKTRSLWNQFSGEPVSGPLADSGLRLRQLPLTIASWADWRTRHPGTTVLSLDTGHRRDYGSGVVYRDYFASPGLMFPAAVDETRLKPKDQVFVMSEPGAWRAWPLSAFNDPPVLNDAIGQREVVLIGEAATRTVRAYERAGQRFVKADGAMALRAGDGTGWRIEEEFLQGPGGQRLPRLPGHVAYWFAWDNYFGAQGTLYPDPPR